nr:hypothetical protein [Tanacetum cinerariifolium]
MVRVVRSGRDDGEMEVGRLNEGDSGGDVPVVAVVTMVRRVRCGGRGSGDGMHRMVFTVVMEMWCSGDEVSGVAGSWLEVE